MGRRVRRVAIVLAVVLLAGAAALVLTTRPSLERDRSHVDDRWTALRGPLAVRYEQLAALRTVFREALGKDRGVTRDLDRALDRWKRLRRASNADADASAEASVANDLEGLAARVTVAVEHSDRLKGLQAVSDALTGFRAAAPPATATAIKAYNDATRAYQHTRDGLLRRPVARLFGYDARPLLVLAT